MAKRPGIIIEMNDVKYIVYNDQPLIKEKSIVILHYVDKDFNLIKNDKDKPKTKLMSLSVYNESAQAATVLGHVD